MPVEAEKDSEPLINQRVGSHLHPVARRLTTVGRSALRSNADVRPLNSALVRGEGTGKRTVTTGAHNNPFRVLKEVPDDHGETPGPQFEAADGQSEPTFHAVHKSFVELLELPEILYCIQSVEWDENISYTSGLDAC